MVIVDGRQLEMDLASFENLEAVLSAVMEE